MPRPSRQRRRPSSGDGWPASCRQPWRKSSSRPRCCSLWDGSIRDNSHRVFRALGPDAGIDSIGDAPSIRDLAAFLGALDDTDELPKTILYSLNPNDNAALVTVMGAFQTGEAVGKVQHGSAWWFNDHRQGMIDQLTTLATDGYLAGFVGMLTDSRSFLSYARHEYFRRILCELLGSWVENGEYPNDENALRCIIEGICVKNASASCSAAGWKTASTPRTKTPSDASSRASASKTRNGILICKHKQRCRSDIPAPPFSAECQQNKIRILDFAETTAEESSVVF